MINSITYEIVGSSKGINKTHITLHVKKIDGMDLTMVELPSITMELEYMYQQILKTIMLYISPK
jgi:predicted aspartyl protease